MFDADHALLPGPVPGHPGDRASAADPVQEAGGRRGDAERAVQLRLPVFFLFVQSSMFLDEQLGLLSSVSPFSPMLNILNLPM